MATELKSRRSTSKSEEAELQQKIAGLCARLRRADLLFCLLMLIFSIAGYALLMGLFDLFAGDSQAASLSAIRWVSYAVFAGLLVFLLLRTLRCAFQRINPYYVARQLEMTAPDAKNSLINWLDLHDDDLPYAFQRHLRANAAEQFAVSDPEQMIPRRKNWIMLGGLALPLLGLLILLVLGPMTFVTSMMRAFVPFLDTQLAARTQIRLLQPDSAEAEIGPGQAVSFTAKIEGRVPTGNRPDAPRLHYRNQAQEDYRVQPLSSAGDAMWATQLLADQVQTGFSYKITAGDAATEEYQVHVRGRAHVQKFEITYHHRPYRKLPNSTDTFPSQAATQPFIHGPRGTEVELVVRASRPVKKASVELLTKNATKELTIRKLSDDPQAFACRWMLEQPGKFRVLFTAADGEDNTDRDAYEIQVHNDEAPRVELMKPGKDLQLPENGTLQLEGRASSDLGLKDLTLRLRIAAGPDTAKLQPKIYRPGVSFKRDDGSYPGVLEYQEFVALDQLKDEKGTLHFLPPGTVLEYWLEAADASDYPNPNGNLGKSAPVYKVTLLPAVDAKQQQGLRQQAQNQQKLHEKNQDDRLAKEDKGGDRTQNPDAQSKKLLEEMHNTEQKIKHALQDKAQQEKLGNAKGAEQKHGENKPGPENSSEGPQPQNKDQKPMSKDDAGNNKEKGDDKSDSGQAKGSGSKDKTGPKEPASRGERKEAPKEKSTPAKEQGGSGKTEPAGGAKDAGPMGMNTPPQEQPKEQPSAAGAPMPQAKQDAKNEANAHKTPYSDAKGIEQEGPTPSSKDVQTAQSPTPQVKGGTKSDPMSGKGESKQANTDQANQAAKASGDEAKANKKEPTLDDLAKLIEKLPQHDAAGDAAGKALAALGKQTGDDRMRDIAKEALEKNGRDPGTGQPVDPNLKLPGDKGKPGKEKGKGPNPYGTFGQSKGRSDDAKVAAANREFLRRIGQMQLDDWKKRMTPDVLKQAGLSDADWQRFLSARQAYDKLVRQMNAKLAKKTDLHGAAKTTSGTGPQLLQNTGTSNDSLDSGLYSAPPDLRAAQGKFSKRTSQP